MPVPARRQAHARTPTAGDQPGRHPGTGLISKETTPQSQTSGRCERPSPASKNRCQSGARRARGFEAQGKEAEVIAQEVR